MGVKKVKTNKSVLPMKIFFFQVFLRTLENCGLFRSQINLNKFIVYFVYMQNE